MKIERHYLVCAYLHGGIVLFHRDLLPSRRVIIGQVIQEFCPPHVLNKVIVASAPFLPEDDMTVGRLTVVDADSLTIGIVNVGVGVILDPPLILSGEEINRANLQTPIDELTGEKIIWKPSKRK